MCFPAAIPIIVGVAQAGLGVMQSIASYSAERAAARESERAYQEQRTLNAEAANRSYQQSQAQLKGEFDQASQKAEQLLAQRLQAQGTTLAAGRSGQSIGGLLTDAQRTEGKDLATLGMNLGYAQQDYSWNVLNVFEQHKSANIQAAAQRKPMPSTGGLLLGIGGAVLGGVSAGLSLAAPAAGGGGGGTPAPAAGSTSSYGSSFKSGLYSPKPVAFG
jgi:hypothetical protein